MSAGKVAAKVVALAPGQTKISCYGQDCTMSAESSALRPEDPNEVLSTLVDGECRGGPDAVAGACRRWRDDAGARAAWHAYHVIGDVLRSEDLANRPGRDAALLAGVRARLAHEPVPMVGAAGVAAAAARPSVRWRLPAALAASVVALVGGLMLMRSVPDAAPDPASPELASLPVDVDVLPASQPVVAPVGGVIRDPQLDALLRAHQWARGGAIGSPPAVMLRNVDMAVPMDDAEPMELAPATPQPQAAKPDAGR